MTPARMPRRSPRDRRPAGARAPLGLPILAVLLAGLALSAWLADDAEVPYANAGVPSPRSPASASGADDRPSPRIAGPLRAAPREADALAAPTAGLTSARERAALDDVGESAPPRAPRPGSVAFHRARFLALAEERPGALDAALAREVLAADRPRFEAIGLLQAMHDTRAPARAEAFAVALATPARADSRHGQPLADYALRSLSERADEPLAAALLDDVARGRLPVADPALRRRAAARRAATAPLTELEALVAQIAQDSDALLLAGVAAALLERPDSPRLQIVRGQLPAPLGL